MLPVSLDCLVYPMLPVSLDCLVYPMLPVSLDCPFVIAPSIFSNVYLETKSKNMYNNAYTMVLFNTVIVAEHEIKINYL